MLVQTKHEPKDAADKTKAFNKTTRASKDNPKDITSKYGQKKCVLRWLQLPNGHHPEPRRGNKDKGLNISKVIKELSQK